MINISISRALRIRVERQVRLYLGIAEEAFDRKFWMPDIIFNIRGTDAGQADHFNWRIYLNARLLKNYEDQFLVDTIPHEVSHLVNPVVNVELLKENKLLPHGQEWANIMRLFGAKPKTHHDYDCSQITSGYSTPTGLIVAQATQNSKRRKVVNLKG